MVHSTLSLQVLWKLAAVGNLRCTQTPSLSNVSWVTRTLSFHTQRAQKDCLWNFLWQRPWDTTFRSNFRLANDLESHLVRCGSHLWTRLTAVHINLLSVYSLATYVYFASSACLVPISEYRGDTLYEVSPNSIELAEQGLTISVTLYLIS